jgi:uncharacterized protein
MWIVTEADLEDIAIGAGILGTGGGGNPYRGKLTMRRHVRAGARVQIVPPEEVPDDALGVTIGGIGAPVIGIERMQRGDEGVTALRALEQHIGRPLTHLVPAEVGGGNSIAPMVAAAQSGLPVVDGDGMGRAFPEIQHTTFAINGAVPSPAVLCDYRHTTVTFDGVPDTRALERLARAATVAMGGAATLVNTLLTGSEIRRMTVPHTLSFARRLGNAVRTARQEHRNPATAVCEATGGGQLFRGKIVDVQRRLVAGFARGELLIDGSGDDRGRRLRIAIQNEYLIAWEDDEVIATAPDLICLVDETTAEPVTTEVVRYGLRVVVIGIPAPELLRTEQALGFVGPRAFGYDVPYRPMPGVYGGGLSLCVAGGALA